MFRENIIDLYNEYYHRHIRKFIKDTNMQKHEIRIKQYNPYISLYPNLKVVSRETLHLIKLLREAGYRVIVEPETTTELNYYVEKGIKEILSDPILAFIIGLPVSFLMDLVSSFIYDIWRKPPKRDEAQLVLEFDERGNKVRYNQHGENVSDERFKAILESLEKRQKAFRQSKEIETPILEKRIPLFLEHTERIIGWAKELRRDDIGLGLHDLEIVDPEIKKLVSDGYLTGLSVGGIVTKSTCSICNSDYTKCNHISTKKYSGKECFVRIDSFILAECSLVNEPVNSLARINKIS
jgi:hypothetical protein